VKHFLLFIIFCALAEAPAWAQSPSQAETQDAAESSAMTEEDPGFFKRFWNHFTDVLFTPQIHKPFSVAGGIEMTRNDRAKFLPELYLMTDYEFSRYLGFGIKGGISFGSNEPADKLVTVMEAVFYERFYVYDFGWIRPFVQTGIGLSIDREQEYEVNDVLGEVAIGARAHWTGWFMEMSVRYGYPFLFAGGLAFGHSFLP
jgi:hypothetical protein